MLSRPINLSVLIAIIFLVASKPPTLALDALSAVPPGKETDVKFYALDGSIITGRDAFERMSNAGLILWLAGNQFFAMDGVIAAFHKNNRTSVGLITLPPGLLLQAIQSGSWIYKGKQYRESPGHLCIRQPWPLTEAQSVWGDGQLHDLYAQRTANYGRARESKGDCNAGRSWPCRCAHINAQPYQRGHQRRQLDAKYADLCIEGFHRPDNLMIVGAVRSGGYPVFLPTAGKTRGLEALDVFESCVEAAARYFSQRP